MQTLDNSAYSENHTFFRDCAQYKMDYRQKMIMAPQQKFKNDNDDDDDDDEDLEALRLAALQSLRTKDTLHPRKQPPLQLQKIVPQVTQMSRSSYKNQRMPRRNYFYNRIKQRQNSNLYYQSPCNPNLIAIVPVDEHFAFQQTELPCSIKTERTDSSMDTGLIGVSKFHRFKDSGNGSEEEDTKSHTNVTNTGETDTVVQDNSEVILSTIVNETKTIENVQKNEDANDINDDDDDILLMADLEEEDSLERLMDEMEREMNVDKLIEKKDRKSNNKHENKNFEKSEDLVKNQDQKRMEDSCAKKESNNSSVVPLMMNIKTERRSISPNINRIIQKRRSLSPKSRSRKKSPRRSPRRSPMRQLKKSQREITRYRSPRKSPPRYSPRIRSPKLSPWPRSPRLSPRRSPNRSPVRRSPVRKLSPRGRSPKLSPHSRSPKPIRSRSPRISSRSRSPRPIRSPKMISRSRSPRLPRSRSPRFSPLRLSPHQRLSRSKSPRLSPRRITPSRRLSPRARSPGLSPRRGSPRLRSPRLRSPKISPRRSPRLRSPRLSPRRSPWSSPRNSPHLSPRRRRSPKWSPKELPRKHGPRSVSPVSTVSPLYMKDSSPLHKRRASPEGNREKLKREDNIEKLVSSDVKESSDTISDPILEARRRKFESTKPIDPINANKKIKLSNFNKKTETSDAIELTLTNVRKINKSPEEDYEIQDADLCLDTAYEFEELEDTMENASPIASSINSSINVDVPKVEKERSLKKKKKRDKEIYQVGKLKNELPLSERIGKDKKCKKRKDIITDVTKEDVDAIFEDITVDEEGDLRAELSRRRAERLNRTVSIQSARLVQSAFKGVVNEVVKNNAKVNQRHVIKSDDKHNQKDVRRVTVLHRSVSDLHDSEDESTLDSKVPIRFRLGLNKQVQDSRESKTSRKTSKRQGRKVKHKNNLTLTDPEHIL